MATVYLAFGSNVGNSKQYIENAIALLQPTVHDIVRAPLYTSKAVGHTAQPDFLNTVVKGQTELTPHDLLVFIKNVEQDVGRIERFRWGPREIDIDIIFYDDQIVDAPDLHIPHAHFAERDFVLRPLNDLNPNFLDPVSRASVNELYAKLPQAARSIIG